MMYPTITASVRQGCTRSVVLSPCCPVPVISGVGEISDTKHVDVSVRMGSYINYYKKFPILLPMYMVWTCARSGSTAEIWGTVG